MFMSIQPVEDAPVPLADDHMTDRVTSLLAPVADAERELVRLSRRATERLAAAGAVVREGVLALGLSETDPAQRRALATRLYWHHPNVAVNDLVSAFGYGSQSKLVAAIGPVPTGLDCDRCGEPLLATTRARLKELRANRPGVPQRRCPECVAAERRAEEDRYRWQWEQEQRRWEEELHTSESADQEGMPAGWPMGGAPAEA